MSGESSHAQWQRDPPLMLTGCLDNYLQTFRRQFPEGPPKSDRFDMKKELALFNRSVEYERIANSSRLVRADSEYLDSLDDEFGETLQQAFKEPPLNRYSPPQRQRKPQQANDYSAIKDLEDKSQDPLRKEYYFPQNRATASKEAPGAPIDGYPLPIKRETPEHSHRIGLTAQQKQGLSKRLSNLRKKNSVKELRLLKFQSVPETQMNIAEDYPSDFRSGYQLQKSRIKMPLSINQPLVQNQQSAIRKPPPKNRHILQNTMEKPPFNDRPAVQRPGNGTVKPSSKDHSALQSHRNPIERAPWNNKPSLQDQNPKLDATILSQTYYRNINAPAVFNDLTHKLEGTADGEGFGNPASYKGVYGCSWCFNDPARRAVCVNCRGPLAKRSTGADRSLEGRQVAELQVNVSTVQAMSRCKCLIAGSRKGTCLHCHGPMPNRHIGDRYGGAAGLLWER